MYNPNEPRDKEGKWSSSAGQSRAKHILKSVAKIAGHLAVGAVIAGAFIAAEHQLKNSSTRYYGIKPRVDPNMRKINALRAVAEDRSVTHHERIAFHAKANEILKRHRRG